MTGKTKKEEGALEPLIKWPGGKSSELAIIKNYMPKAFERFVEPFVGGGSVYMYMNAKHYAINDLSTELISLYRFVASSDQNFFSLLDKISFSWTQIGLAFSKNQKALVEFFNAFNKGEIDAEKLRSKLKEFFRKNARDFIKVIGTFPKCELFLEELIRNAYQKISRMKRISLEKGNLPKDDVKKNIETAIRASLYMYYRELLNVDDEKESPFHAALFYFIRNFTYSGMFRYNSEGYFNAPYGGIGYNNKRISKQIAYYKSEELKQHLSKTEIKNQDFEEFLKQIKLTNKDFIFLDPPYDSEFSTYAKNNFSADDQKRLKNFLIRKCKAKWMLIIKSTDFIYNLYASEKSVSIIQFSKNYSVSFMNRNKKKVTHLLVRNYV